MFTSKEIRQEHRLSTWKVRTNDNRKSGRQCIPLTLMDEPENTRNHSFAREWSRVGRKGSLIVRRQ